MIRHDEAAASGGDAGAGTLVGVAFAAGAEARGAPPCMMTFQTIGGPKASTVSRRAQKRRRFPAQESRNGSDTTKQMQAMAKSQRVTARLRGVRFV